MSKEIKTHVVTPQEKPIRLQEYGVGIFPTLNTKSALKKSLKKKLIFVDGKPGETSTYIFGKETITYHPPEAKKTQREFLLQLDVLFEDEYLAILHKPAGVLVSGNSFKTIANALSQNLKQSQQPDAITPQPAHRLDFATTGLLVIGKTSSALLALNRLFEQKQIVKTYYAITIGEMQKEGTISFAIDTKEACSEFQVQATIPSERFGAFNLVKLFPKTGRRHQLRKHVSTLGNPILGDADYGIKGLILKGKGMYLHAFSLQFIHPITQKKLYIEKELPLKFKKIFP